MDKTLRYAKSKGGKYELMIYEDLDGTFSTRAFENGTMWFASVGWVTRVQSDIAFNQVVHDALPEITYLEQPVQGEEHAVSVRS